MQSLLGSKGAEEEKALIERREQAMSRFGLLLTILSDAEGHPAPRT
jgi:hypothetical protein